MAEPIVLAPSENVTVPVGAPVPVADLIVTVNVTDWPKKLDVGEAAIVNDVLIPTGGLTTCGLLLSEPVLLPKLLSPG
jgi:hypothetical protein